jgi:membrane fusion protein (multidrug efflux system)
VYFNVPEAAYLDYKASDSLSDIKEVHLMMANQKPYDRIGKIETIEADFNNETGNIAFRAAFPNPDNLLRNGQTGNVIMCIPVKQAIIIPQKATFEILDKKYVFVVDNKNIVRLTPVSILAEVRDLFIINSGLKGDENIIFDGIRKVQDKDKIKFQYEDPRTVLSKLSLESE